jgi:Na+/melibiose symporter-like transporter
MRELLPRERKTFLLHLSYSFIEGIIAGLIILNEFVFVKSLLGSGYQLAVLFQLSVAVFMLLIFINEWLKRVQNKRKMIRYAGLLSRLPLAALFFFPRSADELGGDSMYHYIFLLIFFIYYLGNTFIWPTINLFLKSAYRHENFSRLYSYSASVNKVVMMVTTFLYGWFLDIDYFIFVYIFPVAAVLGVVSVFLLSLIPYESVAVGIKSKGLLKSVQTSVRGMINILKTNRAFFDFEMGFMLYGIGFMSSATLIVLFFEYELQLNYTSVAFYKNGYNILAILMLPFFGRMMGRTDPRRFAAISFLSCAIFIVFLGLTQYFRGSIQIWDITIFYTLIMFIVFYGIFIATMDLTWYIGSAYFCPPEEAGNYQAVHLVLTAIRSLFAPLLGIAFYEAWGFIPSFIITLVFLIISVVYMIWSEKRVGHSL